MAGQISPILRVYPSLLPKKGLTCGHERYDRYYSQLRSIFKPYSFIPIYYLPGNHNVEFVPEHITSILSLIQLVRQA